MQGLLEEIQEAREWLSARWGGTPKVGLILGTGLGGLARQIQVQADFAYSEIPHFPRSTAPSHAGRLLCGTLEGVPLMAMEGRSHYHEGYSLRQVTFPVRVMRALGADTLLLTSAVGGMNPQYRLADIAILDDHINLMPDNPLRGINDDRLGPRFPDMSQPYRRTLVEALAFANPAAGTLRLVGADVVGMSTVPECIAALHGGMQVAAFSVVTDMCLPDALEPAEIERIIAVANEGGQKLERLLLALFRNHSSLF